VVALADTLGEARGVLAGAGSRWGVVIDRDGALCGWVGVDGIWGVGTVDERAHRMHASVPLSATLKQAFAEMLQHDAGWVAVLDGDRYLGVLTPDSLHAALRRSVDRAEGTELEASPTRT
ncbi:MAG: CBS domain-containing protein, partial [Acidimicrobiales bacterium]